MKSFGLIMLKLRFKARQCYTREDRCIFVQIVDVCREYGVVFDSGRHSLTTICGSDKRVSNLMVSTGNIVKIWVTAGTGPKDLNRFVIHYTGFQTSLILYITQVFNHL